MDCWNNNCPRSLALRSPCISLFFANPQLSTLKMAAFTKAGAAVLLLVLALSSAASAADTGKKATSTKAPTIASASFADWTSAIKAANVSGSNLTTLFAAISASGLGGSLNASTAWTILAPTNAAFAKRLKALNIQPAALLADKPTMIKILSYHVIPVGAVFSKDLKEGQKVPTLLRNGTLTVKLSNGVQFKGANSDAYVKVADIKVGKSVIHVIDDVLLPAGIGSPKNAGAKNNATKKGAL